MDSKNLDNISEFVDQNVLFSLWISHLKIDLAPLFNWLQV